MRELPGDAVSESELKISAPPAVSAHRRVTRRLLVETVLFLALAALVAFSAIVAKDARSRARMSALAALNSDADPVADPVNLAAWPDRPVQTAADPLLDQAAPDALAAPARTDEPTYPPTMRWFNGRPVRPARTLWMIVTAYTPDEQSCGDSADGITASLHDVGTNASRLVAADTHLLPMGSMLSIPGYDEGRIVPVLDRGGAIKGSRLDVLYQTNERARGWGVQRLPVTVWEYADGRPADNWRSIRDSKN